MTNQNYKEQLNRIALIVKEKGITQIALSEKTGLQQDYISRIFSGKINPTLDTLTKICDAVGIDIEFIHYSHCN